MPNSPALATFPPPTFDAILMNFRSADDLQLRCRNGQLSAKGPNEGVIGAFTRGAQWQAAETELGNAFRRSAGVDPSPAIQALIRDTVRPDNGERVDRGLRNIERQWNQEIKTSIAQGIPANASADLRTALHASIDDFIEERSTQNPGLNLLAQTTAYQAAILNSVGDILNAPNSQAAVQSAIAMMTQGPNRIEIGTLAFHSLQSRGDITADEFTQAAVGKLQADLQAANAATLLREDSMFSSYCREYLKTNADAYIQNVVQDADQLRVAQTPPNPALDSEALGAQLLQSMHNHAGQLNGVQPFLAGIHEAAQASGVAPDAGDRLVTNVAFLRVVNSSLIARYAPDITNAGNPALRGSAISMVEGIKVAQTFASRAHEGLPLAITNAADQSVQNLRQNAPQTMVDWQDTLLQARGPLPLVVAQQVAPVVNAPQPVNAVASQQLQDSSNIIVLGADDGPDGYVAAEADLDGYDADDEHGKIKRGRAPKQGEPEESSLKRSPSVKDMYKSNYAASKEQKLGEGEDVKNKVSSSSNSLFN